MVKTAVERPQSLSLSISQAQADHLEHLIL